MLSLQTAFEMLTSLKETQNCSSEEDQASQKWLNIRLKKKNSSFPVTGLTVWIYPRPKIFY